MANTLYVPVILDVLLVGNEDKGRANVDYDYSLLDEETLFGNMISNRGFGETKQIPGAHLQWTMPDALLHGVKKEDGSLEFPTLPNRFLIQRLHIDGEEVSWKAWIIRSDFVTNDSYKTKQGMRKTAIPALSYSSGTGSYVPAGDDGKMYAFVGSVRPFGEEETETEKWKLPMDAAGLGDPLTTAYYPLSKTVFGFYDNLEEGAGEYTYIVSGYYDDTAQDPLWEDAAGKMKEFGWKTDSQESVDHCLFYGISQKVVWEGKTKAYAQIPDDEVRIDIGNTSMETMASLLGDGLSGKEGGEDREGNGIKRMLHALSYGLLAEEESSDALIQMEEQLHATQFSRADGGTRWILCMQQKDRAEDEEGAAQWKLSEELYREVVELNELNDQKEACKEDLESARQELYSFWYQYVLYETEVPGYEKLREMKTQVQKAAEQIQTREQQYASLTDKISEQVGKLNVSLEEKKLYLKEVPRGFYYEPVPPVLMLSGDGVGRSFRQGEQSDEDGSLLVRTGMLSELVIPAGETDVRVKASEVLSVLSLPEDFPASSADVLGECLLCGEEMVPFLKAFVSKQPGTEVTEEEIRSAQREAAWPLPWDCKWKQPWNPLLLLWDVSVVQAADREKADNTFDAFYLSDLDWETEREFAGEELEFQGLSLLTPHGVTQMSRSCLWAMDKWDRDFGNLKERLKDMEKASVLSQQMSGFYDAFSALSDMPVLPIVSPDEDSNELAKTVAAHLKGRYHIPVLGGEKSPFLPVRGGVLKLNRLRLIDSFGQYKEVGIFEHNVHISESMKSKKEEEVLLRPRFLQPVRVEVGWLSAEHEGDSPCVDGNSTPVTGFLVPNFLDRCLYVYDNQGSLLGSLQEGDKAICWMRQEGSCESVENIPNRYLKNFIAGLQGRDSSVMKSLLNYLQKCLKESAADEQAEITSQCFGRVLALCRAKVSLSGKGRTLKQFTDDTFTTRGYEKEKVPVRLGDERKIKNGMFGYAQENGKPCDVFHILEGSGDEEGNYLDSCHDVELSLEEREQRVLFLMLPDGEIPVRAGFLPAMTQSMQKEMYEDRQESMDYIFRLLPFLSEADRIDLPRSQILQQEWQFFYQEGKESRQKETVKRGNDFREEEISLWEGTMKPKREE